MPSPDWPEKQVKQSTGLQKFFNKTSAKPPPPWKSKTNIANGKGRRASDDVTDRSEHTPRVVAVELKEPKARVWDRGVKNCKNIAKPLVSLQQIIRTSTPRSASPKKKSEKPQQDNSKGENGNLLATVIAVNGDENVVWREVKPNSTSQHASGNKVTVNISSVSPPPVPPLPASLLPPVPPRPTPNLFCLHPKIKLKTLQSAPLSSRPSRIPKLCPNPSGLRSVDCLVSLYEGSNAARRHKIAAIDQEKTTRINSQKLKEEFEEVLKKYEALERECQNLNTSRGSSPESLEPRSAPCSLLHIEDPTANVTRTNSEADLLKPRLTKIIPCNRIRNTKSETEICKSPSAYGIGIVRANTGRRVSESRYRTELEIFFRSGVLAQLEAQRDEKLTDNVVRLQARCRGYLARRKLNKLKIQDLAVRCIQRNVRKFMSVRDWPWWRLLVRVTPLLNVHRTEEELKIKTEELEQLRAKVEKLEQERNHLKHDNDRLEAKLSEMTADLAEEHSTSTLATERLEAETADRLRLEKELQETQSENKNLQQTTERLEMELLYMRAADVNGGVMSDEDEEGEGDLGVYKQRYERTVRELEFTKRRLQQQHEDDLEQLVGLKKQLEKKLADAFEEVEEQRQIVAQWKRKVAKLNAETNDLRLLLEEQNSRNHLLEKKQRKFDSELQLLQDELRQEKQAKERISREKELVLAEKYSTEQNLSAIRLELELKEEKIVSLTQELDELTFGGKTEEEVAHLKKTKHELDKKLKEQEEELDDLAGQVQLLEQAKLRLEMSLEQQRKEHRRELSQRDEELEDARCNAQKKVKALEAQLENEHEERTLLLREKHELERRLGALEEAGRATRATDEDQLHRLRKDLRRTKALLRDAQTQLERSKGDSPGKAILRQLRNQVEDLECARAAAVKARQSAEMELAEVQAQLEEAQRVKSDAEERAAAALRERSDIRSQLEENEEELAEVMKKYRAAVQQLSVDQMALQEQAGQVAELESERASLKEQLAELTTRLESIETVGDTTSTLAQRRLEMRIKELESRLELEQTTRSRMEVQISRLKETVEKLQTEAATARAKEQTAQDAARKLQRTVRELREESTVAQAREAEAAQRRKDLEKRLEAAEAEAAAARGDLRLALTRIQDLQSAIQGELEDCSGSEHSDSLYYVSCSEQDSDGSDDSISTFLANHKMPTTRSSLELDITQRSSPMDSPTKVCSNINSESKESFA